MSDYLELLRDPRWQRMRLEVMQRENFTCEDCHGTGDTFNVHHAYYEKGRMPWEYPSETLHCLCVPCHKRREECLKVIRKLCGELTPDQLGVVIGTMNRMLGKTSPVALENRHRSPQRTALQDELSKTTDHEKALEILRQIQETSNK